MILQGAYLGIQFYIFPDVSKLSDIKVWEAAAVQVVGFLNSIFIFQSEFTGIFKMFRFSSLCPLLEEASLH